jgi:hypothetical protein
MVPDSREATATSTEFSGLQFERPGGQRESGRGQDLAAPRIAKLDRVARTGKEPATCIDVTIVHDCGLLKE